MDIRNRIKASVASRTIIIVFLMVGLILLVFGLLQVRYVRNAMVKEVHRQASRSMETTIKSIEDRVSDVETAVKTASGYADLFAADDEECYQLLERLVSHNTDIAAVTLLYSENFFPEQGRYYAPTVYRDDNDSLVHDEIGGPEHNFCYLETDSNWIYTNKLNHDYWCLPYLDSISTNRPMVTYSVPISKPDGSIYAVLCADVDLNWVKSVINEAKPYPYSRVNVVSRDQHFICHPDSSFVLKVNALQFARENGSVQSVEIMQRMLHWERGRDTMFAPRTLLTEHDRENNADMAGWQIVYYAPVKSVMWSVSFSIPERKILEVPDQLFKNMLALLGLMLLLVSLVLYFNIHKQLKPLELLANSTREMAKGNFDVPLPVINTNDEVRNLRDSFDEMQTSLAHYVEELQSTTATKASMESELKIASRIQMSMLPKIFPPYPERDDIEIYGLVTPAKAVGGDIYDFYIRDEKLFFCIGDVSGKGVPAALVMAVTRTLFRTISAHEALPERIVVMINEALSDQNESNMFVTLFVGVLDLPTGRLRTCNAGHDAPLLVGEEVKSMAVESNIPIGIMSDWKFSSQETLITPHTTIFLYTDGLTEAEDAAQKLFGQDRMMEVAEQARNAGDLEPNDLLTCMNRAVRQFVGGAVQSDDLTMLAIQYTKEQRDIKLKRELTLHNDVQEIPQLTQFVDEVCEDLGFDPSITMQMNLALEEAVVNVMEYAYPAGSEGEVNIEAQANDVRLRFTITDNGIPFDPTAKTDIDTTLSAEERPIGGLGIFLVRELMDSINYERIGGKNVLTLRKKFNTTQS